MISEPSFGPPNRIRLDFLKEEEEEAFESLCQLWEMADVAQLPELKRRLQASVVKVRDHESELTRVETDHPTGDLPINICTRLEQIERNLVRNTGLYRENVKLYEDRLRDAGEETPLDALYKELSDTLEMIDRCHGLINIYRRRNPAIKRGSTPPLGPPSALGGSARTPDPLKDLIKLPPRNWRHFLVSTRTGRVFGITTTLPFTAGRLSTRCSR